MCVCVLQSTLKGIPTGAVLNSIRPGHSNPQLGELQFEYCNECPVDYPETAIGSECGAPSSLGGLGRGLTATLSNH